MYRDAEVALQLHEAVRVCTGGGSLDDEDWRRVLFYQFHDALPGSSIGLVYEEMESELQALAATRRSAATEDLAARFHGDRACLFNAAPVPRRSLIPLPGIVASTPAIRCDGAVLPVQVLDGAAYACVPLPPLAGVAWEAVTDIPAAPILTASPTELRGDRVRARFAPDGGLADLQIDGWNLPLAGVAGFALHREGTGGDAWDILPHALGLSIGMPALPLVAMAAGPVLARVAGTGAFGTHSTLHLTYSVVAGIPWLFADLDIDWREDASWLRFRLPTTLRGRNARYGTPFGSVLRPAQAGDDARQAQWEVPGSRWAAVTDDGGDGAAIISDAKFGWSCDNGVLHLSLLRAPNSPAPGADRGRHHIRFAIGRHRTNSGEDAQTTAADADLLYLPVPTYCGSPSGPAPISLLPGSSLAPAWVLPSAGGGMLRLHEVSGQRGMAVLHAAGAPPWLADVRGTPLSPLARDDDHTWRLPYSPYQLINVTLTQDRPNS